jgi:hypothetical protein
MFPSSEIQILERSNDQLLMVDPPFFSAGVLIITLALIGILVPVLVRRAHREDGNPWTILIAAVPFLVIAIALATSRTTVVFNRHTNSVDIQHHTFGITRSQSSFKLDQISAAGVMEGEGKKKGTRLLYLLLRNGKQIPLSSYSSQQGHAAVAEGINEFLRSNSPR